MSIPASGRHLPRYDFFLLPLLSLCTAVFMLAGTEIGARIAMPQRLTDSCLVADPILGEHAKPDCTSRTKSPEGQWVENRYNECGYRSATPCHAPLNGARRIAVIGSSTGWGLDIPTDQTWYMHTAAFLSQNCGLDLDVQNLGGLHKFNQTAATIPAALAEHPSVVVMFVAPFDFYEEPRGDFSPAVAQTGARPVKRGLATQHHFSLRDVNAYFKQSRAFFLAEHVMFQQPTSYIPLYLRNGDKADFLRQPLSPAWQHRLVYADAALGYIAAQLHRAGVPFVVIFAPQEAQGDLVATGEQLPGIDPYTIEVATRQIAQRHGIIFGDLVPRFKKISDPSDYFMVVDGHLNGKGQALAALVAESTLTAQGAPFSGCKLHGETQQ